MTQLEISPEQPKISPEQLRLSPYLFFFLKDGETIVWDYDSHQQYALEDAYFQRLQKWARKEVTDILPMDYELWEGKLLVDVTQAEPHAWGWDMLAHIYHHGTSNIAETPIPAEEWTKQYIEYCESIAKDSPLHHTPTLNATPLPQADTTLITTQNLVDNFYKRKTCRSFLGKSITLEQLSTLLYLSFGTIHKEWPDLKGLQQLGLRKAFPSGGGLHPEEAYIIALHVEGLEPGIYHYDCHNHGLRHIKSGFFEEYLVELLCSQYFLEGVAAGIFLTSQFEKSWWKYPHSRGYRVSLMDMGHASQTALLMATALGLNTWMSGAFSDRKTRAFLEIENPSEYPLLFLGIGYGDNDSLNPRIRAVLEATPKKASPAEKL